MKTVKGITLIELVITMGIIAIIAGIAIPSYQGYIQTSHIAECNNEIGAMQLAQEEFFLENNAYFPNPVGTSAGIANIEIDSGNLFVSGYTVQGNAPQTAANLAAAKCTYTVVSNAGPGYTITAVGQNELVGIPNIVVVK